LCRRPPSGPISTNTTSRRRAGTSGRARPRQPPRLRRGLSWPRAAPAWCWGTRQTPLGPRHRALDPQRAWSTGKRTRCPAGPLRRGSGGARALGGASRPRRLAQPSAERGAADSQRPGVGRPPGQPSFVEFRNSFPCFFFARFFFDARPSCSACWW
jgi:hypothetical protein